MTLHNQQYCITHTLAEGILHMHYTRLLTTLALATSINMYAQELKSNAQIIKESWQVIRDEDPQGIRTTYPIRCNQANRSQHKEECSHLEQMFVEMHSLAQKHTENFSEPYCTTENSTDSKKTFRHNFCRVFSSMPSLEKIMQYVQKMHDNQISNDELRQFENTLSACGNVYAHFAARNANEEKAMVEVIYEENL